jgi:signal transduction histidine kinase
MGFLRQLFSSGDYMPHGYCYLWNPGLVWLHVISDSLIVLAYFAIPLALIQFVRKRRDLPFHWMFLCFGIFMVACGTTHAMEIWNLWHGQYWLAGVVKAITAAASVPTAVLLFRLIPKALALPGTETLVQANTALEGEIRERQITEAALREAVEEVKALNTKLQERMAQLDEVNRELEAFSYSVSHDLRAPLRHVNGFSLILLEEYAPQLSAEVRGYLRRISGGAQTMGRLVDDLLHLSRVGRQGLVMEKTNLQDLLDEVRDDLIEESKGREIEWRIGNLPCVMCDAGLMRLALVNLLSNALKFSRGRQPAVIEVDTEIVSGEETVFVRDNGVGFDPRYTDKLFGVFQRLHNQEEFEGTGIGLATVQRIIHKHGGRIWASGELEGGATFHFTLQNISEPAAAWQAITGGEECHPTAK